ncbi:MAG: glycosyltransferase [Gemmatimonadaceae bacterium]
MSRYAPVFAGYSLDRSGAKYIEGRQSILLDDYSALPGLSKVLLKSLGRVPRRWLAAIASARPVVIHAHFGTNGDPAIAIARALCIPVLVTYHGVDIATVARSRRERRRRLRVFAGADRVIAVSRFIGACLRDAGCPEEKIVLHHIGVDTGFFSPGARERATNQVLFVGRIVEKKGLVHLVRAMERVRRAVPAAELVVAGDGPLRADMEREASNRGVRATFLGVRTPGQIRDLMRAATVLCGPSTVEPSGNAEGLSMVPVEAQATGLPVVVSISGGNGEGVVEGQTGFLCAAGDESAMAERLIALLTDSDMRARMGASGRDHVSRNFDLLRQTRRLEEIYDSVAR